MAELDQAGSIMTEFPSTESHLLPDRNQQHDLFICDVADAVLKDVMPHMEHPFYSLAKKPDTSVRKYEHNGQWIEITPSVKGMATIYDKDVLIYCISQIMGAIKRGDPVSKRVRINSRDLLTFTNRGTSGRAYSSLIESLDRLEGTRIRTNIITGDEEQTNGFGLIDASSVRRKHGLDGRLLWCDITLSDWVFSAIKAQEVLTLHRDYFRLAKPLERRVYEIARKHCGQQPKWKIGLPLLHKKSGSEGPEWRFRQMIRSLVLGDHLPDYSIAYDADADMVTFVNRGTVKAPVEPAIEPWSGRLDPDAYHEARKAAPGWDVRELETEWRMWLSDQDIVPRAPLAHFVKFCRSWAEKRGRP